jgi:Spy/CpxP family protein refolding chaperone
MNQLHGWMLGLALFGPGIGEELKLTPEQKQALEKIQREYSDNQREIMAQAQQKVQDLMREAQRNVEKQRAEVEGKFEALLTPEQKKKYEELKQRQARGAPPLAYYHPFGVGHQPLLPPPMQQKLDLNAEQKKGIEKIRKDLEDGQRQEAAKVHESLEKARQSKDPEAYRKIGEQFQQLWHNAEKQRAAAEGKIEALLTSEQKKKYEEMKKEWPGTAPPSYPGLGSPPPAPAAVRPFPGQVLPLPVQQMLHLTPEQKEKLARVQKDTEAKVREVLTDAQKKQLDEMRPMRSPMPLPPQERSGK